MNKDRSDVLEVIENTLNYYEKDMGHNDIQFMRRIYEEGLQKYIDRLSAIGFSNYGCVLDAGCGFGQWSVAMSIMNEHIHSCDASLLRTEILSKIATDLGITNIRTRQATIEKLGYSDGAFDFIFCYSVIFISDFNKALNEFKRVLKEKGFLYLTSNGLGWYLYNYDNSPNRADDYDPKATAVSAISNTINISYGHSRLEGVHQVVPSAVMCKYLREIGFRIIHVGPEGSYSYMPDVHFPASFSIGEYMGQEAVYEIMCQLE